MVNRSTSSYSISVEESLGDACSGIIIIIAKFYNILDLIHVLNSFIFNASDFVREEKSTEKEDFYHSLVEEVIEIEVANTIVMNLILIADKITASNEYPLSNIVTLSLKLHICGDVS